MTFVLQAELNLALQFHLENLSQEIICSQKALACGTKNCQEGGAIADKIQLGGKMDLGKVFVILYGFAQTGWTAFATSGKEMFAQPFLIELSFGGGIEFFLYNNFSFMIEFGGGGYIPTKTEKMNGRGFQALVLGCRKYF